MLTPVPSRKCALCSGFVLPLADVIKHLFTEPLFARFAGVRTQGMLDSEFYARLDAAHGGALSALARGSDPAPDESVHHDEGIAAHATGSSAVDADPLDQGGQDWPVADPDPRDEVMTGNGDTIILMFGLFVDGVQLHSSGRSSTTVFSLKCLDLPGFMVGTNMASYNIAFIDGPKEPTCMTQILAHILTQFKTFEPQGITGDDGAPKWHACVTGAAAVAAALVAAAT